MQFQSTLVLSIFAAVAAAQTSSTTFLTTPTLTTTPTGTGSGSTPTGTGQTLSDLVAELPQCGVTCLNSAASSINCNSADFTCLCANSNSLVSAAGPCVALNCINDINQITTVAQEICDRVNNGATPAEISSASSLVASAVATGVSSSTSAGFAPRRTDAPVAVLMGGAAAAIAALAL